jgi:hypothetical protein
VYVCAGGDLKMRNKIYIVTNGHYSDYRIQAVFSNKEDADTYKEQFNLDNVEEWDLDLPKNNWTYTFVKMDKEGRIMNIEQNNWKHFPYISFDVEKNIMMDVQTADRDRAIKVLNEKRTQAIALGIWGDSKKCREMM